MSSEQISESLRALIRGVWPPACPVKRIGRILNVPIKTAAHYVYVKVSTQRGRELAVKLLEEMDRQDLERVEIRRQLKEIAGKVWVIGIPLASIGLVFGGLTL
jgi:hypothetical protein